MLAWTYRLKGEFERAEATYTRVLKDDDHWQGWLSRCVDRTDLERYQEAAHDCEKALRRDPENIDALVFLAMSYNFLGDGLRALPLAQKAIKLSPDEARHYVELVWALHLIDKPALARLEANRALDRFEGNSDILHFLDATQ